MKTTIIYIIFFISIILIIVSKFLALIKAKDDPKSTKFERWSGGSIFRYPKLLIAFLIGFALFFVGVFLLTTL